MNKIINLKIVEEIFKKYIFLPYKNTFRKKIEIKEFKKNMLDPFEFKFKNSFLNINFEQQIISEITRQTFKSIQNNIGLFHQYIFKSVKGCKIPKKDWDLIFKLKNKNIFVEIKNKHNTMNSSSSQKMYMKALEQIKNYENSEVWLAEVLSKNPGISNWKIMLNGEKNNNNDIKRVSIDYLWYKTTNKKEAFNYIWNFICELLKKKEYKIINSNNDKEKINKLFNWFKGNNDDEKINNLAKNSFKNYLCWD